MNYSDLTIDQQSSSSLLDRVKQLFWRKSYSATDDRSLLMMNELEKINPTVQQQQQREIKEKETELPPLKVIQTVCRILLFL
jgi:L-fucose mutarotase/ribose pyranase (RbsD/FucU family)